MSLLESNLYKHRVRTHEWQQEHEKEHSSVSAEQEARAKAAEHRAAILAAVATLFVLGGLALQMVAVFVA